jgi:hypothetical protein
MTQAPPAPAEAAARKLSPRRIKRAVDRYGVRGIIAARWERIVFTDRQVWYELDLGSQRPRVDLPEGFEVRRPSAQEGPRLIEALPTVSADETARRLAGGADLWMALHDGVPAFSCWVFRVEAPVPAARTRTMTLPEGVVCLEDSVTGRDFRGRGLAPAVWTILSDEEERSGTRSIITRIGEENVPSRRAILKSGFQEIALVAHTRRARSERVSVRPLAGETAQYLDAVLTR